MYIDGVLVKFKHLLVILIFCLVVRAFATIFLNLPLDAYFKELIIQAGMYLLMLGACIKIFNLDNDQFKQIFRTPKEFKKIIYALFFGFALLMFSLGENAIEVFIVAQVEPNFAYGLWNFHSETRLVHNFFSLHVLSFILITSILGPIVEEFFFRGLMFDALNKKSGLFKSMLIVSVIFSLLHFSKQYYISTLFFSLCLCYVYMQSKSVLLCAVVHGSYNFSSFLHQYYFDIHWARSPDQLASVIDWLPQFVMFILSIAIITLILKTNVLKAEKITGVTH